MRFALWLFVVILLFPKDIQDVLAKSLFVSQHGDDLNDCADWSMPCRTVRHAVKISDDGDEIYIDFAQGRPYMECENVTKSLCSIELSKSVSFYGSNGKARIQCRKCSKFFTITSPSFNVTRIYFSNLVISNSDIIAELGAKANTELVLQNMVVRDNNIALHSKYSNDCSIEIFNSSFEHNTNHYSGTYLQCANVTVHINSSFFIFTPLVIKNIANMTTRWRKTMILVQNTIFSGERIRQCASMLAIYPYAAVLNVTIFDSEFRNQFANCRSRHNYQSFSTVLVDERQYDVRDTTYIALRNLIFENNYNNWASLSVTAGYMHNTEVNVKIEKSIFRNNSVALRVSSRCVVKRKQAKTPEIILADSTFVENFYELVKAGAAAAIVFRLVNTRVLSCRFLDNRPGLNPYVGVVTISEKALVTFSDCYFENCQTTEHANQLFASGTRSVFFIGKNTFNLIALSGSQSVFSRVPTIFINTKIFMKKNFKIICPQGYKLKFLQECENLKNRYMCYYINVQCEQCPTKTYTLERGDFIFNKSNDVQCLKCPKGGDCDSGLVKAKPNFWGFKATTKVNFVQCPPGYCCNTADCITYNGCHGNRSGTLCGQCPEGMSESLFSTQCISNNECSLTFFFISGTIALVVLYLVFFLYHTEVVNILQSTLFSKRLSFLINRRTEQRNNSSATGNISSRSGLIRIFFYYYQFCQLLRSSVGSPKKGLIIHDFESVVSRLMNIVLVNLPSINCPLKDLRAVPKAVLVHSLGYILLGVLCLFYLISKLLIILKRLRRNEREAALQFITRPGHTSSVSKSSFSLRVASAFTYISLLMYASSAQLCLSLLHCVRVDDHQVLFLDGNIKCYQTFQYFFLAHVVSSVLPFCLVPVLGSFLLKLDRIGVKQFCAACIFPLPFCCFWLYLLIKEYRGGNQAAYNTMEDSANEVRSVQSNNEGSPGGEGAFPNTESAILKVLLGPFRSHQTFMCFPPLHIPWEGFLIFRRLVLIIVLTFVYDIQLKLFLALTLCVAILILHMLVKPFQRKLDNLLETFSLGVHVVLCGLTLIKSLYYGEDYSSMSKTLFGLNVLQTVFIVAPWSVIVLVVVVSIVIKLVFGLKFCILVLIRKIRWLVSFAM